MRVFPEKIKWGAETEWMQDWGDQMIRETTKRGPNEEVLGWVKKARETPLLISLCFLTLNETWAAPHPLMLTPPCLPQLVGLYPHQLCLKTNLFSFTAFVGYWVARRSSWQGLGGKMFFPHLDSTWDPESSSSWHRNARKQSSRCPKGRPCPHPCRPSE